MLHFKLYGEDKLNKMTSNTIRQSVRYLIDQLIRRLPHAWIAELFRLTGNVLNVKACTCEGDLGIYEGHLQDKGVLGYYLVYHTWEPQIQQLLIEKLFCHDTGTFIDVGANIGLTTIPLKLNRSNVSIIAVEADPDNFVFLKNNLERNSVHDVTLFNVAACAQDGELAFERSPNNAGDHRLRFSEINRSADYYGESNRSVISVKTKRLDSIIQSELLTKPIVLKCDVQGSEVHVLGGAEHLLKVIDFMVIEFWPYGLLRAGTSPESFFSKLNDFRYGLIIEENTVKAQNFMPIEDIMLQMKTLIDESSTDHCELILSKTQYFK